MRNLKLLAKLSDFTNEAFKNVIPGQAGIQKKPRIWVPVFSGMTCFYFGIIYLQNAREQFFNFI